ARRSPFKRNALRMFKKAVFFHPPIPARQGAPFHSQGLARSARRRIRSLTFADGRELVSAQCLRGKAYFGPYVEPSKRCENAAGGLFQHPVRPCPFASLTTR